MEYYTPTVEETVAYTVGKVYPIASRARVRSHTVWTILRCKAPPTVPVLYTVETYGIVHLDVVLHNGDVVYMPTHLYAATL